MVISEESQKSCANARPIDYKSLTHPRKFRVSPKPRMHFDFEETIVIYSLVTWMLVLMHNAAGPTIGDEPEDSYQWLEDVTGRKALAWVKERNAESVKELARSAGFRALERRILEILDSEDRIPDVEKLGPYYYNFWRDAKNPRGLWRRTTLEEYKKAKPAWEIVLDLDRLGEEEKVNWVWHGAQVLKPHYKRALVVALARGGRCERPPRVRSHHEGVRPDGFVLPEAKSQIAWRNHDSVFVGTDFGPGSLTESGYPRLAKEWKRGAPLATATLVMEARPAI